MLQYQDLINELKDGKITLIYILVGEEEFLIAGAIDRIVDIALSGGIKDFNYSIFNAKENGVDEALNAAKTFPLMAQKRAVVLKGIDQYPPSVLDKLSDYIADPSPSTCLIITAKKVDQRTKFFKLLNKNTMLISCNPLYDNQIKPWIRSRAKSYSLEFTDDALDLFAEVAGNELGIIDNELKKLSSYGEAKKRIEASDVEDLVGRSRTYSIFSLINAIGEKSLEKALFILKEMLNDEVRPLIILSMIARQFRLMAKASELQKEGLPANEISKRIGLYGNILHSFLSQLKNFTIDEILKDHGLLYYIDSELKSGIRSQEIILNNLLFKLCSRGERPIC